MPCICPRQGFVISAIIRNAKKFLLWLIKPVFNLHKVADGVWRSAQPYGFVAGLMIDGLGLKAIINLRGANPNASWYQNEVMAARDAAIMHIDITLSSRRIPSAEKIQEIIAALRDTPRPFLLKCSGGADRSSLVAAIYWLLAGDIQGARQQCQGWPYLHRPKKEQRWIKAWLDYVAEQAEGNYRAWLSEQYDPAAFISYLEKRGLEDGFRRG